MLSSLISEQFYICCYCGIRISIDLANCHIEHIKPRETFLSLSLEYRNMLASCNAVSKNEHCGHRKSNWYDEDNLISPLDPSCEDCFQFTSAGEIISAKDINKESAAKETISRLNLNHDILVRRRKTALEGVLDDISSLSTSDINKLISEFKKPNDDGNLTPFCFAIIYVLKQYV